MTRLKPKYRRKLDTIILVSIVLFMIGNVIRIQHWLGKVETQIIGLTATAAIIISLMIYYSLGRYRTFHQGLGLVIVLAIISVQQLNYSHIQWRLLITGTLFALFGAWTITNFIKRLK